MLGKHASGSIGSAVLYEGLVVRMIVRFSFGISQSMGSCPESLVARAQARLFGVAGSNPPGSVSSLLSHRNDFVFLYTVTNPGCIHLQS